MSQQLSPHAQLVAGKSDFKKIVVSHPHASGEVYLHGAHVTHWQPAGHEPVIFLSPLAKFEAGKAIRGGIPICLPWFGPLAGKSNAPMHGFARTTEWTLGGVTESATGVTVTLKFDAPAGTSADYPNAFAAKLAVTFGHSLAVVLKVSNTGTSSMKFEEALHTYYRVEDVREATVSGLHNTFYLDKPSGGAKKQQADMSINFGEEVDRVYLGTDHPCGIHDSSMARTITVEKQNSRSTVVWNPAEARASQLADLGAVNWPKFVCVETANIGDAAVTLAPGDSHEMHLLVRLDGIAVL